MNIRLSRNSKARRSSCLGLRSGPNGQTSRGHAPRIWVAKAPNHRTLNGLRLNDIVVGYFRVQLRRLVLTHQAAHHSSLTSHRHISSQLSVKMAPSSSVVSKLKVQLKLSIQRLRMTQQKDSALAKQQRRAMAQLIEQGKLESARIRVENIIRSDITTELHEILELYCELLLARSQLLDPPTSSSLTGRSDPHLDSGVDPGLEEAVRSIIYAAPRTEVKELNMCRNLLVEKFGKEFALSAMEGEGVAERVLSKLKVEMPKPELVDAYLRLICNTYSVHFPGDPQPKDEEDDDDYDDDDDAEGRGGGQKVKALEAPLETEELSKATPPRAIGPQSPVRVAPPSPSTDNIAPGVKVPGQMGELKPSSKMKKAAGAGGSKSNKKEDGPGGKIPDVDELAKRFAALKR